MIGNFLGYFEKPHSYVKTALATFGQLLEKLGYFLLQHLVALTAAMSTQFLKLLIKIFWKLSLDQRL